MENNGTPFTDEQWKRWYGHKSNKERFMDKETLAELRAEELEDELMEFEQQEKADREADDWLLKILLK